MRLLLVILLATAAAWFTYWRLELHLRCIARGSSQTDVTDRTLASDLLLLDHCVERFRAAMERGWTYRARSPQASRPANPRGSRPTRCSL